MRRILIAALCLAALPAAAGDLSGRWNVTSAARPDYEAVVLVDEQRRVTWDSPNDVGRPAKFLGYIRFNDVLRIEIVMTDRTKVVHIDCLAAASEILHCHTTFPDGKKSPLYALTRVGSAPSRLTVLH